MELTDQISEAEVLATFLKGEMASKRFGADLKAAADKLGADVGIIVRPDLDDANENETRRQILAAYRGYGANSGLFEDFPQNIDWHKARLTKEEVLDIKYINYSYWNDLSNGTRLPSVAAKNIISGYKSFNVSNQNFLEAERSLKEGVAFPKLILVAQDEQGPLVALE